jgi:hypothetical protein
VKIPLPQMFSIELAASDADTILNTRLVTARQLIWT